ncbi:MAG: chromate transporter [Burkholderiaceae bacterium]
MTGLDDGEVSLTSLLLYFAVMSLTAVGGGVLMIAPDIERYIVEGHHWITSQQFVAAYTIAQASPGPNLLFVSLIGLQVAGVVGAVASTIAVALPTFLLSLAVARFMPHGQPGPVGQAIRNGLVPISVGLLAAAGFVLARNADHGWITTVLTIASTLACWRTRINPFWLIAAGAGIGIALQL